MRVLKKFGSQRDQMIALMHRDIEKASFARAFAQMVDTHRYEISSHYRYFIPFGYFEAGPTSVSGGISGGIR